MRYGFFHGTEGDVACLEAALELLADCDRIVCLGGLVGRSAPGDAAALEHLGRIVCLSGEGERHRARDAALPAGIRATLRALPEATVLDGIALLGHAGRQVPSRREAQATGGAPRLVAPLTVTAGSGATRLWRAAGGLCRVEELTGQVRLPLGGERIRLDLAPAKGDGAVRVAVIDRTAGRIELRERAVGPRMAAPVTLPPVRRNRSRRRPVCAGQQLLAV